jgi:hypothetical protein
MMQFFNRLVTIVALLGLITVAALVAVGVFLPDTTRAASADAVAAFFALPGAMPFAQRILTFVIAAIVILLAFIVLVLELRPAETGDTVQVRNQSGEVTGITRQAIRERVQFAIDRLDDVIQVEPIIKGGGSGLTVHLDVVTSPYIEVPMKTEEIRATTREVIEKQMGLTLKKLTVTMDHERYRDIATPEETL